MAPELRVPVWIDGNGATQKPLKLADMGSGYKIIYCFQAWCPGCHSRGFPTLQKLIAKLPKEAFGFAVVQTVFEGADQNTKDKLREMQLKYDLKIPFGHDVATGTDRPTIMNDYNTGGTPWFILIGPKGNVIFSDFGMDADKLIEAFDTDSLYIN